MAKTEKLDFDLAKRTLFDLRVAGVGIDDVSEQEAINLLRVLDDIYFNDTTASGFDVDDQDYDEWKVFWGNMYPDHPYFDPEVVGSDVRGGKIKLPYTMGSLTQSYLGDTQKFLSKYNIADDELFVVSHKLDGQSGMGTWDSGVFAKAFSRGNGFSGADISRHLKLIPSVPKKILIQDPEFTIRGEMIISLANFEVAKTKVKTRAGGVYKNPRAMIAGLMNAAINDPVVYQYIDFVAYSIVKSSTGHEKLSKEEQLKFLAEQGFKVVHYHMLTASQMTDDFLTSLLNQARDIYSAYELDGIVYEVNAASERKRISPSTATLNPEYARKFKVAAADNIAEPIVKDILWEPSRYGFMIPRINIEPTPLCGVTVNMATGFNASYIHDNKIGPGSRIRITRSGDVIPYVTGVVEPTPIAEFNEWFKDTLDGFGEWVWIESGVHVVLTSDHPDILVKRTLAFFTTIEAPNIGEGTIRELNNRGYKTPMQILAMDRDTMGIILGENGYKAYDGLVKKLSGIRESVFMAASGCFRRGIGRSKLAKVLEAVGYEPAKLSELSNLLHLPSIGDKTAVAISAGISDYIELKGQMLSNCEYLQVIRDDTPYGNGVFDGMVFIFTGFRSPDLKEKIQQNGGLVVDSYSKKVTHVVTNDPGSTSGKMGKAIKDNKIIITPDHVDAMI